MSDLIYPKEAYLITGLCMQIHRILGFGLAEIVYKDALTYELGEEEILFEREKKYEIIYKNIILPHFYFADFLAMNKIIIEIKAKSGIANEDIAQTVNYLKISGCKLGLIFNFGKPRLEVKRIVNTAQ